MNNVHHTREWFESNKRQFEYKLLDRCANCGGGSHELHHIVPLALGGTNNDSNIVALCVDCHSLIHGRDMAKHRALQRQGINAMPTDENGKKYSKKTGRATGRPCAELPEEFEEQYQAWKRGEQKATETFKNLGLTKTTFYKLVKQYEQTKATE